VSSVALLQVHWRRLISAGSTSSREWKPQAIVLEAAGQRKAAGAARNDQESGRRTSHRCTRGALHLTPVLQALLASFQPLLGD
jgi:hypothetical protein